MNRVVVTGMGAITPLGNDWETVSGKLKSQTTGIRRMDDWKEYTGLNTHLAAPVDFTRPSHYSRKQVRSMGRVAMMGTYTSELALKEAGLFGAPCLKSARTGVSFGSASGSFDGILEFASMLQEKDKGKLNATSYLRMMGHTCPVNIGVHFGIKGRIIPTSSACTSGSQGIGFGYEAIKHGDQTIMIAGGSDELSASQAAVFDTLFATSLMNRTPAKTPRPFDQDRDGLVIGEGSGTFILEEKKHALNRDAKIYAEVVGFGTNSDGLHATQPDSHSMQVAMELALQDAGVSPEMIGYVSAHGTATELGDIAESHATAAVFGNNMPISSMKSYTGHTLGACGSIEAWAAICMMNEGWFHPTVNLDKPDSRCAELDYIRGDTRKLECEYLMSNNFAFGGINTSLIFKREI